MSLDARIADWRGYVSRSRALDASDVDELEGHLRDRVDELVASGLDEDEAFLIGVKRLGAVDELSREYARVHSGRMWKQLVVGPAPERTGGLAEAVGFAAVGAVAVQLLRLALADADGSWLARNLGLAVLAVLAAYLLRRRRAGLRTILLTAAPFAIAALVANLYPFPVGDDVQLFGTGVSATLLLQTLHLPIALWFAVGIAYADGEWRSRRMDFVRFTGELVIYYVLIALGGGVLLGLASLILEPVLPGATAQLMTWVLPSGAAGAVVIAAWLVEAKQSVIENIAPVLTAVFTPLFAVMAVVAAASYAVLGIGREFDRDLLTVLDALLVVVLGLVLYGLSARSAARPAGPLDIATLVTVAGALLLDALVLASLIARIGEYGWTANRVAALGLNVVLIVGLAGAAWLIGRFVAGRAPLGALERWQLGYLPAYGAWAALVAIVLPPIFGFR